MRDHSTKEDDTEINMTPMLDIVFIMLIFFIVTAVFVKEAGVTVFKPDAETSVPQKRASIMVAITDNNEIHINRERVENISDVRTLVEKLHAENPKGTVVIQADKNSSAGVWMDVYEQLRKANIPLIATATET